MNKKDAFLKKVGKQITKLREEAGLSQTDLAIRCGKNRQNISRLEKGRANATVEFLLDIATGLKVPVKDLFDFE